MHFLNGKICQNNFVFLKITFKQVLLGTVLAFVLSVFFIGVFPSLLTAARSAPALISSSAALEHESLYSIFLIPLYSLSKNNV